MREWYETSFKNSSVWKQRNTVLVCNFSGPRESVIGWLVLCASSSEWWLSYKDNISILTNIWTQKNIPFRPTVLTQLWFGSVQFSCSVVSDSFRRHEPQHARPPCPSPTPRVHPNPCPSSWWCHPTISFFVTPSRPALNLSHHQGLFKWLSSLHQVAKLLEFQLQHQSFQWTPRTDL